MKEGTHRYNIIYSVRMVCNCRNHGIMGRLEPAISHPPLQQMVLQFDARPLEKAARILMAVKPPDKEPESNRKRPV